METLTSVKDYDISLASDGTYCVVVTSPEELPVTVDGFANLQEAEEWVYEQRSTTGTEDILPSHI